MFFADLYDMLLWGRQESLNRVFKLYSALTHQVPGKSKASS
jgi:hypothetical protein